MSKLWTPSKPALILNRRGLITGAAAVAAMGAVDRAQAAGAWRMKVKGQGGGGGGGSYPLGVQGGSAKKLLLQAAWDTKNNSGLSGATSSSTSVNGNPPSWGNPGAGLTNSPAGTWSLSNWFINDRQALLQGTGTFNNCKFNNPGSTLDKSLCIDGSGQGAMIAHTFNDCLFDGTGMVYRVGGSTGPAAFIKMQDTGATSVTFNRCYWFGAPLCNLKPFAATNSIIDSFIGTFGFGGDWTIPDHMESMFFGRGDNYLTGCRIDSSDFNTDPHETMTTAIVNVEGKDSGNVSIHFKDCCILGAQTQGNPDIPSPIGLSAGLGQTVDAYFENCAIERGTIAYIICQTGPTNITCHDLGDNVDLDTNAPLTITSSGA